eukprot:TRINITY_DN20849_c2_g1_i1.p1 TRINITY_DN20849_c2_g1~~TRINITY_DN20849_c2_g1_i1.p1  ORF type:complete len:995 (-),score=167.31 TRINITY_DN20849_c2_g1_i1:230-3214(-)
MVVPSNASDRFIGAALEQQTSRESFDAPTRQKSHWGDLTGKEFLANDLIRSSQKKLTTTSDSSKVKKLAKKKGALAGVFVPTCENMWGVLIFLRFYYIVGEAGIWSTLCAVSLSFLAACCTTCAMSSIASSGGLVSGGGPYYMISRALGPVIGATVGVMYWLAITMLSVLECLGAVEAIAMAAPGVEFAGYKQALGSGLMLSLALMVWGGINVVTKLSLFFAFIVVFTLFCYYEGLFTAGHHFIDPSVPGAELITGLSWTTFQENWHPDYSEGANFGLILSLFYPCFTGILSGANRADTLKDPPKDIRRGTFAAIIFSFFMYVSFFVLWGSVADRRYLRGDASVFKADDDGRGDVSEEAGRWIVSTIVWNPFPKAAYVGIIIASLSQSLQCLIVAPRLLQQMAKDRLLILLRPLEETSSAGEPVRALLFTYIVAACLVLLGNLELVAPLLTMCFLVAYAFMNLSCFTLTWLKSPSWRPSWIHRRRWRILNLLSCGLGVLTCVTIMILVNWAWALAACGLGLCLYIYMSLVCEAREWGSAVDGIQFRLAVKSLMQLENSQHQKVNWRPNMLIIYKITRSTTAETDQEERHKDILRFSSQLRKGRGFCVVACVLESEDRDQHAMDQAEAERNTIREIMKEEGIEGFSEVVIAPTWAEGTNYIIQLTGIGGLVPNTVMLHWPEDSEQAVDAAQDFVKILSHAQSADKAVLAVKGLKGMPLEGAQGTIDVWWMIHDGGFLILLSWLLMRHKNWRKSNIRVFTMAENVSQEQAQTAGESLTRTLQQKRLFDVDVEVILVDDAMIEPYTYDWTVRLEDRHQFLATLPGLDPRTRESIPLQIDDLFTMDCSEDGSPCPTVGKTHSTAGSETARQSIGHEGCVTVSDARVDAEHQSRRHHHLLHDGLLTPAERVLSAAAADPGAAVAAPVVDIEALESCKRLNSMIVTRSSSAQLVVMNLPDQWGSDKESAQNYMMYCNTLTEGLDRVMFVHSSGHEVFEIF